MEQARRSRGVGLAILLAACLSSVSAFGLHPEPATARELARSAGMALVGTHSAGPGQHDCLACRAHRPLVLGAAPAEIPNVCRGLRPRSPRRSSPPVSFAPASFDGRAPPRLS